MNEYQAKTTNAKIQRAKKLKELKKASGQLSTKQHKELLDSISSLQANISSLEASLSANGTSYTESQKDLVQNFSTLQEILQSGLNVNNLKDIKQAKEIIVSNLKDIPKPVINTHKTEIPKWLASDKSVQVLNDNVIKVVQALIDLEANIKPSQNADEFVPFRRVIRQGNQLVFDDSDWASRSGGGGSGGGSTGGLTDAELRATPVPVSMSSDIEIGAVELKNGTDDTRAEVTAGNALKVDGSAVTQPVSGTVTANLGTLNGAATAANQQTDALTDTELRATPVPVSGTVTATPTGTQNVDVTANTIGLATSAKQDTIIGHVDGLETAVGSTNTKLDTVNTNLGTIDGRVDGLETLAGTTNSLLTTIDADTGNLPTIETNTDFGTVTGGGTETGALRVTVANNSTGVLSVDDNGNSLTVDGTVTANLSATDNAVLDNIDANTTPTTGLNTGRKVVTTAGTAVALASSTTCKWVAVTAETDNTSTVVVGDSGVIASLSTREGVPLGAGDSIVIPIDNLADVYIDSLVNGEGVTFLYGT